MNEKFLEQLKGIYIKLGGQEDLTAENSLIVILDKIYKQMGGEKEFKEFSVPEAIDLIEDEVGGGGSSDFSIAQLTITEDISDSTSDWADIYNAIHYSEDLQTIEVKGLDTREVRDSSMCDILLYKGKSQIKDPNEVIISTDGAIEKTEIDGGVGYIISGDCYITIKSYGV